MAFVLEGAALALAVCLMEGQEECEYELPDLRSGSHGP